MPFPVEEKFVELAEAELGAEFPASFRSRMIESNGGSVPVADDYYHLNPVYDTSDRNRIKRTCNSIVHETNKYRDHYGLARDLIVLGDNGGGDLLVYRVEQGGQVDPKVYWRDRDTEELIVVANDFSELEVV